MAQISLQSGIIYGPVFSRRLGRSLGINLLSKTFKICSFDCVYCQYGPTNHLTNSPIRAYLPSVEEVLYYIEKTLRKPRSLDYLTFSGNGEPTLHPDFLEIIKGVKQIRDRLRPDVKLGILSNSTRVMDSQVRQALKMIDAPMMKLDAGDEDTFRDINQPMEGIHLEEIMEGLSVIPQLMIQSVLIDGEVSNIRGDAYQHWIDALRELRPGQIHIYSAERPTANEGIVTVSPKTLLKIEDELVNRQGLNASAFWFDGR
jgi:wyosine [tRNA(Phe)-imidazoG37] synthetase (radical SAM superfamily)